MKHPITLFLLLTFSILAAHAQTGMNIPAEPLTIGEVRVLRSEILHEERILNIYLPYGYDKEKAYPVIYLLDGSIDEDFVHITGLAQFFRLQFNMPDFIIVGIANVDRKRDFTFHTDIKELQEHYPTTGHSEAFIRFLELELQPYIQSVYKTQETRYLIGQSLGGLLATEILLKKPELFSHYLIVSPSLWWDNESLLDQARPLIGQQAALNKYVYISVGKQEDKIMQREAKQLAGILKGAQKPGLTVVFLPLAKENHATILHQSINEAFKGLFPYKE